MDKLLKLGETIGDRYRIIRNLSGGTLKQTYLAEDTHRFDELCVIKACFTEIKSAKEKFEREAKILYTLHHPQIPQFREFFRLHQGEEKGLVLVEEYIVGETYRERLKNRQSQGKTYTEEEVTQLLLKLLPVLDYLHAQNLIHRNLNPDCLILRLPEEQPVLSDFSTIKQLSSIPTETEVEGNETISAILYQLGKIGYAPEEQIQRGSVFPHSDLYALAVTVLVLLTGKEPPQLINPKTLEWDWKQISFLNPELTSVLKKMLEKKPGDRFPSATAVMAALKQGVAGVPYNDLTQSTVRESTVFVEPAGLKSSVPEATSVPDSNSSVSIEDMASITSTTSSPFLGCFGKLFLVLMVIFASGGLGWFAGKMWIHQAVEPRTEQKKLPFDSPVTNQSPSATPVGSQEISSEELERRKVLRARRINLGIERQYFVSLVDQYFFVKYPERVGKTFTNNSEDAEWRKRWDEIAAEFLDKLEFLSPEALQGLGTYNKAKREGWKQRVNQLHLSSRALYDIADATFFSHFPEQENQKFSEQPIGQVWNAITFDSLKSLEEKNNYEKIEIPSEGLETQLTGNLQAGEGKAYVANLKASQTMTIKLESERAGLISVYGPSINNNILEDSPDGEWTGSIAEKGFYEFIIVSKSNQNLNYKLHLKVK
jgi:serine/threonine-protein kinase